MSTIEDHHEPRCRCCNGTGMHESRPFIHASPYDTDAECSACSGTGTSWFDNRPNTCSAYRDLMKAGR